MIHNQGEIISGNAVVASGPLPPNMFNYNEFIGFRTYLKKCLTNIKNH